MGTEYNICNPIYSKFHRKVTIPGERQTFTCRNEETNEGIKHNSKYTGRFIIPVGWHHLLPLNETKPKRRFVAIATDEKGKVRGKRKKPNKIKPLKSHGSQNQRLTFPYLRIQITPNSRDGSSTTKMIGQKQRILSKKENINREEEIHNSLFPLCQLVDDILDLRTHRTLMSLGLLSPKALAQ